MNNTFDNEAEWRLTAEEIRSVKGYEDTSDEDVENIINTFALLGQACYESYLLEQNKDYSPK